MHYNITGTQVYGQTPDTTGASYTVTPESGVTSEGLAGTQGIDKSKLGVTNIVTNTSDVGDYANAKGITAVDFTGTGVGTNDFKASNYVITMDSSDYTVTARPLHYTITGTQSYGDTPGTTGTSYIFSTVSGVTNEGLVGTQNIDKSKLGVTNIVTSATHVGDYVNDAGITDVTGFDTAALNGFKKSNYNIIKDGTDYEVTPVALTLYTSGQKFYGTVATTASLNEITGKGWKNSDAATLALAANQATIKGYVDNSKAAATGNHVGSYGTEGTDSKAAVLTYDTTEQGKISDLFHGDYTISYTDKFDITPATLTVTVTGERNYGTNLPQNSYTTADTATKGTWNVKLEGLAGGDTAATVLNDANVKTVLNAIDSGDGTATTTMGSHTNAGTYSMDATTPGLANTKVDLTANILTKNANGNYDYDITDGDHQVKIDKINATITTTGTKTYGAADPGANTYSIAESGLKDWDKTSLYGTDGSSWKSGIVNATAPQTDANVYGTEGTSTNKNAVLSYALGSKLLADLSTNYDVVYKDQFSITPADLVIHISGNRTYGSKTSTSGADYTYDTSGATGGLQNGESINYKEATVNFSGLDEKINAGSYYKDVTGKADTTGNTIDSLSNITGTGNFKTGNYNISYTTDYTVNRKDLTIITTGTKVYGDTDQAGSTYTLEQQGLNDWDVIKETENWKDTITNSTNEQTDAGAYGTQNGGKRVIGHGSVIDDDLNHNYNITYVDNFAITKRPITHSLDGTKEYGTGSEHTTYTDNGFTNVPAFAQGNINANTPKNITNTSDRTTPAGDYDNNLLGVTYNGDWTKNYDIAEVTRLTVAPAQFIYTATPTDYWQGEHIPSQSGHVANRYGEDVSDLTGVINWPTPADGLIAGRFPINGHGANDSTGNYYVQQADGNATALLVREKVEDDQMKSISALSGGLNRYPLLDIRYFTVDGRGISLMPSDSAAPAVEMGELNAAEQAQAGQEGQNSLNGAVTGPNLKPGEGEIRRTSLNSVEYLKNRGLNYAAGAEHGRFGYTTLKNKENQEKYHF